MMEGKRTSERQRVMEPAENERDHGKRPLAIYLHIPFCVRKCLYCDFLSAPASTEEIENYVNLLLREIRISADGGQLQDYEAATVFLGGGTPSLLTASQIETILCKLRTVIPVPMDAEITTEMNPGTVTKEKLADLKRIGINRISIGVQSLRDEELQALGRIHRTDDVYRMWKWIEEIGYVNRNIDLMTGIPGQTESSLRDTLEKAAALAPEHISAYSLIVEEGTPFYERYPNGAVDEETDRQLYALTKEVLKKHGYERYEISNYAKDGYACRHNLTYWTRGDYLGFGLGAASLMNDVRFRNAGDMAEYERHIGMRETRAADSRKGREPESGGAIKEAHERVRDASPAYAEWEPLSVKDRMAETMFLGLRLTKGVSERAFYEQFGCSLHEVYGSVLEKHRKKGLLQQKDGFFFLTEYGLDVSNYVMADFLL